MQKAAKLLHLPTPEPQEWAVIVIPYNLCVECRSTVTYFICQISGFDFSLKSMFHLQIILQT